ncbi:YkgJ family cysteine cluster protein [Beijerinckiaceae bacterium]|nr:YkgJ family cysteine cluster protein [Beijerinckiaceae bacterium]
MSVPDASNPIVFFKAMCRAFAVSLVSSRDRRDPIESLSRQAFESFAEGVALEANKDAPVACRGGCASCCAIRVVATAPEVLSLARQIRAFPQKLSSGLKQRILAADRATRLLDQQQRMDSSVGCPLIEDDYCGVYAVRPLACRGHASFDEDACRDALKGGAYEVPISALHLTVRSLVQNAMQSALRDAGLAWGSYELNQALAIALSDETCERAWMTGDDVFASALITDVSLAEMAETFDALKAMAA